MVDSLEVVEVLAWLMPPCVVVAHVDERLQLVGRLGAGAVLAAVELLAASVLELLASLEDSSSSLVLKALRVGMRGEAVYP